MLKMVAFQPKLIIIYTTGVLWSHFLHISFQANPCGVTFFCSRIFKWIHSIWSLLGIFRSAKEPRSTHVSFICCNTFGNVPFSWLTPTQMSWVRQQYCKDLVQQLLPYFPYTMHERAKKKEKGKEKSQTPQVNNVLIVPPAEGLYCTRQDQKV